MVFVMSICRGCGSARAMAISGLQRQWLQVRVTVLEVRARARFPIVMFFI